MRFKLGDYIVDCHNATHVMVECVGKHHTWDPTNTFLCPWCEEAAGRVAEHVPQRMDHCLPCKKTLESGERHYFKQGVPGSTLCLDCGKKSGLDKYKHWLITECRPFHRWTDAEVSRGKPTGEFSSPDCNEFCCASIAPECSTCGHSRVWHKPLSCIVKIAGNPENKCDCEVFKEK